MNAGYAVIDLSVGLLESLEANVKLPIPQQIEAWQSHYAQCAPELPERLYKDYAEVEGGWRTIAEQRIFPHVPRWLGRMKIAASNLRRHFSRGATAATRLPAMKRPPVVVVYVGLGNGAGWATTWRESPAILLGLENIADLGWHEPHTLRGLIAHETGHLVMNEIRSDMDPLPTDPLFSLFCEGFAQYCEHRAAGCETWCCASQDGWLAWCREHEADLARQFLLARDDRQRSRAFFGSWYDVGGWRQTGYYLGCRFIQTVARAHSLEQIAAWPIDRIRRDIAGFLARLQDQ